MNAEQSLLVATEAHEGQFRKKLGEKYICHPIRVSKAVAYFGEDYEIVGLLHDVVEDNSSYTFKYFEDLGFKKEIIDALKILTKNEFERYSDYIYRVVASGNHLAIQVKLADLKDNLRDADDRHKEAKYELALKYINLYLDYKNVLNDALSLTEEISKK